MVVLPHHQDFIDFQNVSKHRLKVGLEDETNIHHPKYIKIAEIKKKSLNYVFPTYHMNKKNFQNHSF